MFKIVLSCFLLTLLAPGVFGNVFGGTCMFHDDLSGGYACRLENGIFFNRTAFAIQGTHLIGRTDQDVRMLFTLNSNMWRVPQEIFDRFPNLERLRLVDMDLRFLDEIWGNCSSLNEVVFDNNTVSILPEGVFQWCHNLESLTFSGCRIQQIHFRAFFGVPQLQTLRIVDNGFSMGFLSPNIFHPTPFWGLRHLELNNIGLTSLWRSTFTGLRDLTFISLNDNQIQLFEHTTFNNLPSLQHIQIRGNRVNIGSQNRFEGQVFVNLNSLLTLDFQNSNIAILGVWTFGLLPTVVNLNFRNMSLVQLEGNDFFDRFPNLGNLDVQSNICINRTFAQGQEPRLPPGFVNYFVDCFNPWATTTTTLGASSMQSSLALILSFVILIKLRF